MYSGRSSIGSQTAMNIAHDKGIFNANTKRQRQVKMRIRASKDRLDTLLSKLDSTELSSIDWQAKLDSHELIKEHRLILLLHSLVKGIEYTPPVLRRIGADDKDTLYNIIRDNKHGIEKDELHKLLSDSLETNEKKEPKTALGIIWYQRRGFFNCHPNRGTLKNVSNIVSSISKDDKHYQKGVNVT